MAKSLIIRKPDDWHLHCRDGDVLADTINASAQHFQRALLMPNLTPPLTTIKAIDDYQKRVLTALDPSRSFTPFFTLYLNESVSADDINRASQLSHIFGAKLYPAGATTNSAAGADSISALYPLLDLMQQNDLVLQIHGEQARGDIFEREQLFLSEQLAPIIANFPKLRIVLEHVSTKAAVDFVNAAPANVAATITVHHLLYNRNHMLAGGIKPHYYCLPILKKSSDQQALIDAATSGNAKFFLGTDSAPHAVGNKINVCGCAGIYSAPYALALYAQAFDQVNALDKLEDFASVFGAEFYQLPLNQQQVELIKQSQQVPEQLSFGNDKVVPIAAGTQLEWQINER